MTKENPDIKVTPNKVAEAVCLFSPNLFWDIDTNEFNLDKYQVQIIQRVLEYGHLRDWRFICRYYGIPQIAECCKKMRTLDSKALAFISTISHTNKEDYRCYSIAQSS